MDRLQAVAVHVSVDLGGGDGGMAEQFLDHAQVGAGMEHMRGERMAQRVGGDPLLDPGR